MAGTLEPTWADKEIPRPLEDGAVYLERRGQEIWTNVPHSVVQHSPAGYEWSYAGSGPADLALNIIEWTLRHQGYEGEETQCFQGTCLSLAWHLHQTFKRDFLMRMPLEGGVIGLHEIEAWITGSLVRGRGKGVE